MAYFLRQEKKKKGTYLQMYESYWDKEKKQPRSKSIMAFGYAEDLISDEIPDPIAYYKQFVRQKNEERAASLADETRPRTFVSPVEKMPGIFSCVLFWMNWMLKIRLISFPPRGAFSSVSMT